MSSKNVYFIKTITNLHVGSGDTTYGVIDNMVQRDCVTNYPIINSSSLKGALRAFFECTGSKDDVVKIFGKDSNTNLENDALGGKGKMAFFDAKILFRPVRSNKRPYVLVTCPQALSDFFEYLEISGIKEDEKEGLKQLKQLTKNYKKVEDEKFENISSIKLQEIDLQSHSINIFNDILKGEELKIYITTNEEFKNLELPVIARNQLENGESKNLWYEEVVPRKSIFYFMTNCEDTELDKKFEGAINEKLVQIGGNATIGYGFCNIDIIKSNEGNNE
ncbi:type III-B CRISPR module RAMP protein Cmr4 [Methanococcus voltae]|uniref:CRISPR-associated RAMP protein, Cmr4 family n=1 Tax=Methanococcus voltae (strain ATCC BAA-1334 / A3) TaxID=456320 RepID=D7DST2_METV3|nr:type III-B CRISPR module RAMP protein Cmr4 [Methanococcus voltae]MCS3901793.1 CRISPR-associated protein Cmr4 [Methanococcus voltae]